MYRYSCNPSDAFAVKLDTFQQASLGKRQVLAGVCVPTRSSPRHRW